MTTGRINQVTTSFIYTFPLAALVLRHANKKGPKPFFMFDTTFWLHAHTLS